MNSFSETVKDIIRKIPAGRVCTYGIIAACAGNPGAARQVARILHSCSKNDGLPWHRVVNQKGRISLLPMAGFEEQKKLLQDEGVEFNINDVICFDTFLWIP